MFYYHIFSFCSRNKKVCKGQPCETMSTSTTTVEPTTVVTTTTTSKPILDQSKNITIKQCLDGWSTWIHVNRLHSKNHNKFEYLPTFEDLKSVEYKDIKWSNNTVRQ